MICELKPLPFFHHHSHFKMPHPEVTKKYQPARVGPDAQWSSHSLAALIEKREAIGTQGANQTTATEIDRPVHSLLFPIDFFFPQQAKQQQESRPEGAPSTTMPQKSAKQRVKNYCSQCYVPTCDLRGPWYVPSPSSFLGSSGCHGCFSVSPGRWSVLASFPFSFAHNDDF
jgi:hypothetical protein